MPLVLAQPQQVIGQKVEFLRQTYAAQKKSWAVIAVSGGIDSGLSLSLVSQALGADQVWPVLLPYGEQDLTDGEVMLDFVGIPEQNRQVINIQPVVMAAAAALDVTTDVTTNDKVRFGNLMARVRMMMVYDLAKKHQALVCGTENKSEKYLGYFTRFGDEASDIEPLIDLYKTQVRQLAEFLQLPAQVRTKQPSAGLWADQTDAQELGFSYEVADQVLVQLIDEGRRPDEVRVEAVAPALVQRVIQQVERMAFKHRVPYTQK